MKIDSFVHGAEPWLLNSWFVPTFKPLLPFAIDSNFYLNHYYSYYLVIYLVGIIFVDDTVFCFTLF